MAQGMNRRQFIVRTTLVTTAAGCYRLQAEEDKKPTAPSDKLNVAFVGANGKATSNLAGVASTNAANIVAMCDIDSTRMAPAAKKYEGAKTYGDYRKLLEQKDIDAVVVTTADHTHAVAAMAAMKLGKHVYVEKPMCHNIAEVRTLTEYAKKNKIATQMGNHGTSSEYIRRQAEWVRDGIIGKVKEIHCWSDRPVKFWPQDIERPTETPPVPEGLNWDAWIGPAPMRPYHPAYHPFKWRGWWDFGTGALGDMGCHIMNYPFFTFKLPAPTSVEVVGKEGGNEESGPKWSVIKYTFPAFGDQPSMTLTWHDGGKMPEKPQGIKKMPTNGTLYVGEKGIIHAPYMEAPELASDANYRGPKPSLPRSKGHYVDWVEAAKGGPPAGANFPEYAGPLSELVLLGNVALRAGKKIEWDAQNMKITNDAGANKFLSREYRAGWSL